MNSESAVKIPTPESSPYLFYGDDDIVIESMFHDSKQDSIVSDPNLMSISQKYTESNQSFFPVSFNDIKIIKKLSEKYYSKRPHFSFKGKIVHFIYSHEKISPLLFLLGVVVMILLEIIATAEILETISQHVSNQSMLEILITTGLVLCTVAIVASVFLYVDKSFDLMDYPYQNKYVVKLNKKDRRLLKDKIFLRIPNCEEGRDCKKNVEKISTVIDSNVESLDLYGLENLYHRYMEFLSYIIANKGKISPELYLDYYQRLRNLSQDIEQESENILSNNHVK